jgi:hypothetical protein
MMTSHLGRFQLERLAADHPQARAALAPRVHLSGCDLCRTRLRALVAARLRFLTAHPDVTFAREVVADAELPGRERTSPWWVSPRFVHGVVAALALGVSVLAWFAHGAAASWSRASRAAAVYADCPAGLRLVAQAGRGQVRACRR